MANLCATTFLVSSDILARENTCPTSSNAIYSLPLHSTSNIIIGPTLLYLLPLGVQYGWPSLPSQYFLTAIPCQALQSMSLPVHQGKCLVLSLPSWLVFGQNYYYFNYLLCFLSIDFLCSLCLNKRHETR